MFGKGVLALKRQPNDGSHPTDIAGGWCGFKMDHRCWCFVGQKPVSLQGLHRCSQMSNFCSQTTFIEKAFSRNLLPEFQRVPSLNKTALIGSLDPLQLLGTPRVYPPRHRRTPCLCVEKRFPWLPEFDVGWTSTIAPRWSGLVKTAVISAKVLKTSPWH